METNHFSELARHTADCCLTVTLSLPAAPPSARDSHVNSVVSEAGRALAATDLPEETAEAWLEDLRDALTSKELKEGRGCVYLRSPERSERLYVPLELDRTVAVAGGFLLAPLHPLLGDDNEPVVLALSRGGWRLLTRSGGSIRHIDVPDAPKDCAEANQAFEQPIEGGPQHANTSHGTGPGAPRTHRQGFGHESPEEKQDLRYVEALARSLTDAMNTEKADIVVVGLSPLASTFRDHTSIDVSQVLFTDPQTMSDAELLDYVNEHVDTHDDALKERFSASKSKGMFLDTPDALLEQARAGNISVLRMPSEPRWMSPETHNLHDSCQAGDLELLTVLAGEVLAHGGTLVEGKSLGGIQRWPLHPTAK